MKCPHCQAPKPRPSKSKDRAQKLLQQLFLVRYRCDKCMHTFHISRIWALLDG